MLDSFTHSSIVQAVWPVFAVSFIISTMCILAFWVSGKPVRHIALIALSMSLLGVVTGQLTGLSREPAVAAVLPAVLTILSAMFAYILGAKDTQTQTIVATGIICLVSSLLIGTHIGAEMRVSYDESINSLEDKLRRQQIAHQVKLMQLLHDDEYQREMRALSAEPE